MPSNEIVEYANCELMLAITILALAFPTRPPNEQNITPIKCGWEKHLNIWIKVHLILIF